MSAATSEQEGGGKRLSRFARAQRAHARFYAPRARSVFVFRRRRASRFMRARAKGPEERRRIFCGSQ